MKRTAEEELVYARAMLERAKARWLTGDVFTSYVRMWEKEVTRLEAERPE